MSPRPFRRLFFLALITAGVACAPPIQNGGVEVRTGAAERFGIVCRWRLECGSGFAESGGDLIDDTDATTGRDELGQVRDGSPGALAATLVDAAGTPPVAAPSPAKPQEK